MRCIIQPSLHYLSIFLKVEEERYDHTENNETSIIELIGRRNPQQHYKLGHNERFTSNSAWKNLSKFEDRDYYAR